MKSCWILPLLLLVQVSSAEIAPHTFGVFGDPSGQTRSMEMPPFVVSDFYVMAINTVPMAGWEASMPLVGLDWNFLGVTLNPPSAILVSSWGNFIVGLGGCYFEGPAYELMRVRFAWFVDQTPPTDVQFCLQGSTPSSFHGIPGYASCENELIAAVLSPAMGDLAAGCLLINPRMTVRSETASWGNVKSRF